MASTSSWLGGGGLSEWIWSKPPPPPMASTTNIPYVRAQHILATAPLHTVQFSASPASAWFLIIPRSSLQPQVMTMVLVAQLALLAALFQLLTPAPVDKTTGRAPGDQPINQ